MAKRSSEWPLADTDVIDRKIAQSVRDMRSGKATSADVGRVSRLVDERIDRMMPKLVLRLRAQKKA